MSGNVTFILIIIILIIIIIILLLLLLLLYYYYYYYYYTNVGGDFRFCNYATTFSDISNKIKIKIIRKNVFVGTL